MGWEPRSATGRDGPAITAAIPLEIAAKSPTTSFFRSLFIKFLLRESRNMEQPSRFARFHSRFSLAWRPGVLVVKTERNRLRLEAGFSLIEVTAAIALVAFAMLAILGLIPVALKASRDAVDDTRASLMAQDAVTHVGSLPSNATKATLWYDGDGRYLGKDTAPPDFTNALYRADITLGSLNSYPANTDPDGQDPANGASTRLKGAAVVIGWPVNTADGKLPANGPNEIKYSFLVRTTP
ncbi:MAG TPA: hypothetical protein VIU12_06915 [Chryseolinea sp.]